MTRRYEGCGSANDVVVNYRYLRAQGGKAWMATRIARTASGKVTLCTTSGGVTRYPFSFLLTTSLANSTNPRVRAAVRSVQRALRHVGIRGGSGTQIAIDGSYGPQTGTAVRKFQQREGLIVDGKVGEQTWRMLGRQEC